MRFPQRIRLYTPRELNPANAGALGQTLSYAFDRIFPWEEMQIHVCIVAGATGPTFQTGTQQGLDNILNIIRRINLTVNDGVSQPYSAVNISGIGALSHVSQEGINLDSGTLAAIALAQNGASIANNQCLRLVYRIPFMPAQMGEPLRSRCLLPVHIHKDNPILTLDFETAANIYSAGSIAQIYVDVVIIQREMTDAQTQSYLKDGGFIRGDLTEFTAGVPLSSTAEFRISVPNNGSYTGIGLRQYLGGASMTRGVIDGSGIGTTVATGFGLETPWTLEFATNVKHKWRNRILQSMNDCTRVLNGIVQTSSPRIGGVVAATTSFSPAADVYLDFLGDGLSGDTDNELGSVLDANVPLTSGSKWEIVVPSTASVATNPSVVYVTGRRLFGDLSRWKTV